MPFTKSKAGSCDKAEKNQHIQVVVRCRPINSTEKKQGSYSVVDSNSDRREVHVKERLAGNASTKTYTFDRVFGPQAKQIELYKTTVVPIIEEVLQGYNCTIFAYGQTGSGKTFTMEGERSADPNVFWEDDPLCGIIPRSMHQIFERLDRMDCEYTVRVSFLEIYNEELIDLLGAESVENPRLKIYEDITKKGSHVIQGLEEVSVLNRSAVYSVLERGTQRRQTAATLMNAHSSRSHSVFMVTIHMKENSIDGEELLKTGKLNLVDLAGSECIGRSGAVDKRAREAGNINQSLLTLGRVITALVEHAPHVPYRESKLTRLLQDSLGGRTKTSIIATISPASSNIEETLSTLDYAHRAKNITNRPEINQKLTKKALLKEYTTELERLRKDLQAARDKNGFFIDEENYNSMQTQMLQQKDNIKELQEKIDYLNAEMEKLNDLFTETKEELDVRTKELIDTNNVLSETNKTLEHTRDRLRDTRQDRDEQHFLVKQHIKTETKLYSQASELLHTANNASGDAGKLHDKLDRVNQVTNHNRSAMEVFRDEFRQNTDSMERDLKHNAETQIEHLKELDNNMDNLLSQRLSDVDAMMTSMTQLGDYIQSRLTASSEAQQEFTNHSEQWTEQLLSFASSAKESEVFRQFELHEDMMSMLGKTKSMLTKLSNDLSSMKQTLSKNASCIQETITAKKEAQLSKLAQHKELFTQYCDDNKISRSRQMGLCRDIVKFNEESQAKLLEQVKMALACHTKEMTECMNKIHDDLSSSDEKAASAQQTINSHIDEEVSQFESDCLELEQLHHRHQNDLDDTVSNQLLSQVSSLMDHKKELEEKVANIPPETSRVCEDVAQKFKDLAEEHLNETKSSLEQQKSHAGETTSGCSAAIEAAIQLQKRHLEVTKKTVPTVKAITKKQNNVVVQWSETHHNALEAQDESLETFLKEEMRECQPTGETPARKKFSYPTNLSKTERKSLLLEQFRETYLLEEAMNTPLPNPNDSLNTVPTIQLDELDEESTVGESSSDRLRHNSSGSSESFRSSESKENAMRPPSTSNIPTKPNSSRSRSTSRNQSTSRDPTPNNSNKESNNTPGRTTQNRIQTRLPLRVPNNNS